MYEYWKKIKDYPNYAVSNLGRVKNRKTEKILNTYKNSVRKGKYIYTTVIISKGTVQSRKCVLISRLVAEAFIPNPNKKPEVNHLDFNPQNNHISNLEWSTHEENIQHSFNAGRLPWSCFTTKKEKVKIENEYAEISRKFLNGEFANLIIVNSNV